MVWIYFWLWRPKIEDSKPTIRLEHSIGFRCYLEQIRSIAQIQANAKNQKIYAFIRKWQLLSCSYNYFNTQNYCCFNCIRTWVNSFNIPIPKLM